MGFATRGIESNPVSRVAYPHPRGGQTAPPQHTFTEGCDTLSSCSPWVSPPEVHAGRPARLDHSLVRGPRLSEHIRTNDEGCVKPCLRRPGRDGVGHRVATPDTDRVLPPTRPWGTGYDSLCLDSGTWDQLLRATTGAGVTAARNRRHAVLRRTERRARGYRVNVSELWNKSFTGLDHQHREISPGETVPSAA